MSTIDTLTTDAPSTPPTCWICRSNQTELWKQNNLERALDAEDLRITDDRYGLTLKLWRCSRCEFIFADNSEFENLVSLYEQLNDSEYDRDYDIRSLQMQWILKKSLEFFSQARTALDIGSASGILVNEAQKKGLQVVGIEPSQALVDAARQNHCVDLIHGVFPHEQTKNRQFDLVFLVDVIEHVDNPLQLLRDCAQVMHPQSVLVVVTPDIGSITARLLGKKWWHLRLAHVGYFNQRSFRSAAERAELKIVASWRAKWFFRVSYLAHRLENYLPLTPLNRWLAKTPFLRSLLQSTIPLNLHDSNVFVLKTTGK